MTQLVNAMQLLEKDMRYLKLEHTLDMERNAHLLERTNQTLEIERLKHLNEMHQLQIKYAAK